MQTYIGYIHPISTGNLKKSLCTVIYFAGCNFRCIYCNKPEILGFKNDFLVDEAKIKEEIISNKEVVDCVFFSGGEPLLHKEALLSMTKFSKLNGLKIGIETNGSRPDVLKALIRERLIDYLVLDIKAPLDEHYNKITNAETFFKEKEDIIEEIKESIRLLKLNQHRINITFKTVIIPGYVYRKEDVFEIISLIKDINCTYVLQKFKAENTLDKNLRKITEPSDEFLQNLKEICLKEFPDLKIEIRE
jgi:pyruvate formate lyase activating enzyme